VGACVGVRVVGAGVFEEEEGGLDTPAEHTQVLFEQGSLPPHVVHVHESHHIGALEKS
jgi:hypothetical protein